jgi:uroporphyrin-3 C-methyltransferase
LRAAPGIDVQGLYLRLEALMRQAEGLVLYEVPKAPPPAGDTPPTGWRARLSAGLQAAVEKLSNYIVVSRREVPVESLMDPQYEALVRQNLRMLLEQAQVAMLAQEEMPYRHSLERAEAWVTRYFGTGGDTARAMAAELRALGEARVSAETPTLAASLDAMEAVMRARSAAGDG